MCEIHLYFSSSLTLLYVPYISVQDGKCVDP